MNSTIAGRLFFGGVSITGLYLGSWQVERYYWKKEKIGKEKDAFSTDANKIQFSFDKLDSKAARQKRVVEELEEKHIGRKVLLQGKFIPGHDVLLGLRSIPLSNGRKKAEGMSVNPQGYFVISPFRLENNQNADGCPDSNLNPIVYINRGWIPLNMKQQGYSIPDPNTTKELECVVAAKEKASIFSPPNEWKTRKLVWLENEALVLINNDLHPEMLEPPAEVNIVNCNLVGERSGKSEENSKTDDEGKAHENVFEPIPMSVGSNLQEHYVTPEMHVAYAFTWFSLALFSAGFGYYRFRPLSKRAIAQLKKM